MLIQLGDKPLADFSQPLQMLHDCHRRIEYFLDVLRNVEQRTGQQELDKESRSSLERSLDYFAHNAPKHTADEEGSLFPRLRACDSWEAQDVIAELDRLEHDHRTGDAAHALVDKLVRQWLTAGPLAEADRVALRGALVELTAMYRTHIDLEENRVFALAAQLLGPDQLQAIGQEMKARRALHVGETADRADVADVEASSELRKGVTGDW